MDEMEFDRTRKAIGSDAMRDEERKQLLDQFTAGGGKVLDEKALRRREAAEKSARSGGTDSGDDRSGSKSFANPRLPSELRKEQRAKELERLALERRRRDEMMKEASGFFARLGIKIRAAIAGLSPFGGAMVSTSALSFFSIELRKALIESNILGNELLTNNQELLRTLKQELKNPFYIELMNRVRLLYNRQELNELLASYSEASPRAVPLESVRVPLLSLLRKLYALLPYRESFLKSVQVGIILQQRQEKKAAELYVAKQREIERSWRILMEKAFPKILLLVQRLELKNIEPGHPLFEEMIGFTAEHRIQTPRSGAAPLTADEVNEATPAESKTSNEAENQEPAAEKEVDPLEKEKNEKERKKEEFARRLFEYGLSLQKRRTPNQLKETYDARGEYPHANLNDKAFLSYLLLRFFDDQMAFILTTQQLQLEPIMQSGVRINLKQDMADIYEAIRSCYDLFRSYYHDFVEYKKALDEGGLSANYVDHAKKVSMFETRRGKTGREVRLSIKNYMLRVEKMLGILLKDMKDQGIVVKNPNDLFVYELEADRQKMMNGRKMKEIIRDAYAYAHVLARRLENGDLYGGVLELSDEDFKAATGDSTDKEAAALPLEEQDNDAATNDSEDDTSKVF